MCWISFAIGLLFGAAIGVGGLAFVAINADRRR
jgi:hypothetical protein